MPIAADRAAHVSQGATRGVVQVEQSVVAKVRRNRERPLSRFASRAYSALHRHEVLAHEKHRAGGATVTASRIATSTPSRSGRRPRAWPRCERPRPDALF
jgi:hypothetical protein